MKNRFTINDFEDNQYLSDANKDQSISWIMAEEGKVVNERKLHIPFVCKKDRLEKAQSTIGYGRLLPFGEEKKYVDGVDEITVQGWLKEDIAQAMYDSELLFPKCDEWDDYLRAAIMAMAYQMGMTRLSGFRNMCIALRRSPVDLRSTIIEAGDSLWARTTPNRASRTQQLMLKKDWSAVFNANGGLRKAVPLIL